MDFKPLLYYRYVDDIFAIIQNSKIDQMLNIFNSIKLITNWHRKPTLSGRFLNFKSQHPLIHKKSIVYNLVDRATILSDIKFHKDNLKLVENLLVINDYPPKIYKNLIKDRLHYCLQKFNKSFQSNDETIQREDDQTGPKYFLQFPFLKDFHYKVSKNLKKFNIVTRPKFFYNLDVFQFRQCHK